MYTFQTQQLISRKVSIKKPSKSRLMWEVIKQSSQICLNTIRHLLRKSLIQNDSYTPITVIERPVDWVLTSLFVIVKFLDIPFISEKIILNQYHQGI